MRRSIYWFLGVSLAVLPFGEQSQAAFILELDQTAYSAISGEEVTVSVILREVGDSVLANNGLLGVAALLRLYSSVPNVDVAATNAAPSAGFLPGKEPLDGTEIGVIAGFSGIGAPLPGSPFPGKNSDWVILGEFTLTVTGEAGDEIFIVPDRVGPGFVGNYGPPPGMVNYDAGIVEFHGASITLAPIPEPSSLAIWGCLAVSALVVLRRRR